jgi:hypothetical protein
MDTKLSRYSYKKRPGIIKSLVRFRHKICHFRHMNGRLCIAVGVRRDVY